MPIALSRSRSCALLCMPTMRLRLPAFVPLARRSLPSPSLLSRPLPSPLDAALRYMGGGVVRYALGSCSARCLAFLRDKMMHWVIRVIRVIKVCSCSWRCERPPAHSAAFTCVCHRVRVAARVRRCACVRRRVCVVRALRPCARCAWVRAQGACACACVATTLRFPAAAPLCVALRSHASCASLAVAPRV